MRIPTSRSAIWLRGICVSRLADRKSTRLNSSHTEIYTLSLHDALPILNMQVCFKPGAVVPLHAHPNEQISYMVEGHLRFTIGRSEEHTSELQSHRDLHSFPTRRSSDLEYAGLFQARRSCSAACASQRADQLYG